VLALALPGCSSERAPSDAEPAEGVEESTGEDAGSDSPAPRAEAKPQPAFETVRKTVPAGTTLELELSDTLGSDTSARGDTFQATITDPVLIDNMRVIPAGSVIEGVVADVQPAKKFSGNARIVLTFKALQLPSGYRTALVATLVSEGEKTGKKSGAIIGGSAAGGAVLGKVIGGDSKDGAIGAIIGGAIGAGVAASQDKEIQVPAGTYLILQTEEPLQIPVKVRVEG
jgi:hypothetical protein